MAAAEHLILSADQEILTRVLKISLPIPGSAGAAAAASTTRGGDPAVPVPMPELAAELVAEAGGATSLAEVEARWSTSKARQSLFDRALVGRISDEEIAATAPTLDYLAASYGRCNDVLSRKRDPDATLREVFTYVSTLCVSYAAIVLSNPGMFPQPADAEAEGVLRLLRALREDTLPSGFLSALVARLHKDGGLGEVFLPIFAKLAEDTAKIDITQDFGTPMRVLGKLVAEKPLGALMCKDVTFLPAICSNGALLQMGSRLAPFLGISCFPADKPELAKKLFDDIVQPHNLDSSMSSLRGALTLCQRQLHAICTTLLKNAEAKEPLFCLLAKACTLNGVRAQQWFPHEESHRLLHAIAPESIQPSSQARKYSFDGFLVNLGAVLLALCDPFTVPNSPHASKIDPTYLFSGHRLAFDKDETRLAASADEVAYFLNPTDPELKAKHEHMLAEELRTPEEDDGAPLLVSSSFGTISEYYFLTMRVLHVGLLSSFAMLERLMKEHSRWSQDLQRREQELMHMRSVGGAEAVIRQLQVETEHLRKWIDGVKRYVLCYQTQLADPALLSSCVRYYRLVSRWLVATAQPPASGLPLKEHPPRIFAALPEFVLEDVATFLKNLTQLAPQVLEQMAVEEMHDFVTLMVTFISAPKYVKNPYLRATFTKLLCYLVPEEEGGERHRGRHASDRLSMVFHTHTLAQQHLAPAVMQFFVDIEFTDGQGSDYDKYEYRHEMTQILEYLWSQPNYRVTMVGFAKDATRFVRFVNMLINDSIYAFDEALTRLVAIRNTQAEMRNETEWAAMASRTRQQRTQQHQQDEGTARYFMQFANEVLHMLRYISADPEVAVVFMLPELIDRMSQMLNHFLAALLGPKCATLKVDEPERYNFNAKKLLLEISITVVQFSRFDEFAAAMVRDERSYDPNILRRAIRVLATGVEPRMQQKDLLGFEAFCKSCLAVKESLVEEEADLGDAPDEFLDPITQELMSDPVVLPSTTVVDRTTILRHLLSDEHDPFSRQRCTPEMLVPDAELKARIESFKREAAERGRQRRKEAAGVRDASAPMDTS